MHVLPLLGASVVLFALAACQTTETGGTSATNTGTNSRVLVADEMLAYAGRSLSYGPYSGSQEGRIAINRDGTLVASQMTLPGLSDDTGTWRVSGDRMCTIWDRKRTSERCVAWRLRADGIIDDGLYLLKFD